MNKAILNKIFRTALIGANPKKCISESIGLENNHIKIENDTYDLNKINRIFIISFGKSSIPMSEAISKILKNKIYRGLVISNDIPKNKIKRFSYIKSSHPVPNKNSLQAGEKAIKLLNSTKPDDLVIFLISGGGSSLMAVPKKGISLKQKQELSNKLLRSGLDIKIINFIRKKISSIKGGQLLNHSNSLNICNIVISDVIDGKFSDIASGPTVKNKKNDLKLEKAIKGTTFFKSLSLSTQNIILKEATPYKRNHKVKNYMIGNNGIALSFAKAKADELGYKTILYSSKVQGEASLIGKKIAKRALNIAAQEKKSVCLIFGGESTVKVKGNGVGGRNMELALSFAIGISGKKKIRGLFAGTDGIDGNTNSAGAYCDSKTVIKASAMGIDAKSFLKNNDSYNFFKKLKSLKITGNTGCNVNDIGIILIDF